MNNLTFTQLREINVARCEEIFHPLTLWSVNDWATAWAGEVGETCNLLKKIRRGRSIPVKEVEDEMADSLIYLDLLAARMGINLAEAVTRKFNRVSGERGSSHYLPAVD